MDRSAYDEAVASFGATQVDVPAFWRGQAVHGLRLAVLMATLLLKQKERMDQFEAALVAFKAKFGHRSWCADLCGVLDALKTDVGLRLTEQEERMRVLEKDEEYDSYA